MHRPIDLLFNSTPKLFCSDIINYSDLFKSFSFDCLVTVCANKIFDDPFSVSLHSSTIFCDPYYLGYYVLGIYLLSIAQWIIKHSLGYEKILFLSRDGFVVKKVYDILRVQYSGTVDSDYLYVSRKMLLPFMLNSFADFFFIPSINVIQCSPEQLINILDFCTKETNSSHLDQLCKMLGLSFTSPFMTKENYYSFISVYYDQLYDVDKHSQTKKTLSKFYNSIADNSITFDLGNYGRVQSALNNACKKRIDALFLFSNDNSCIRETRKNGYLIKTFYNYYPSSNRKFREYLLSDTGPSCIGVQYCDGEVKCIFDSQYQTRSIREKIHQGIIDYICDLTSIYERHIQELVLKPFEASLLFENYLLNASDMELQLYKDESFDHTIEREVSSIYIEVSDSNRMNKIIKDKE